MHLQRTYIVAHGHRALPSRPEDGPWLWESIMKAPLELETEQGEEGAADQPGHISRLLSEEK
jgi:hypothetical protein